MIQNINDSNAPRLSESVPSLRNHKRLFNALKNKDGEVDKNEFLSFAKKAGVDGEQLFKALDNDGNGKITEAEFKAGFQQVKDAMIAQAKSQIKTAENASSTSQQNIESAKSFLDLRSSFKIVG
ncbi:MAG: EF-hand domain-containing protein [Deltaproteobacteria bacterium]|nr:EF-hand domain-containing protein [Deltaproteobacteria bacterium]